MPATQATPTGAVVVAVDLPRQSDIAIAYAAEEAVRCSRPLVLVHAVDAAVVAFPFAAYVADVYRALEVAAGVVRDRHPALSVDTQVVMGSPARELVLISATARLVVVGSRGTGGFTGLLLGSVAGHVATHAQCPVVVVPGLTSWDRDIVGAASPVLVGVDGSADSSAAVDFAFDQAQARGVILVAASICSLRDMEGDADRLTAEAVAGQGSLYPDVVVKRMAVLGSSAAYGLLDTAESVGAGLVVVGSRGLRAAEGLVLGSVSQQLTHHGDRPVAVVRSA